MPEHDVMRSFARYNAQRDVFDRASVTFDYSRARFVTTNGLDVSSQE
jgi:hypothetical protein